MTDRFASSRTGVQHRFPLEGSHVSAHKRNCDNVAHKDDAEQPLEGESNKDELPPEVGDDDDDWKNEKSNAQAMADINKQRRKQKALKAGRKAAMLLGKKQEVQEEPKEEQKNEDKEGEKEEKIEPKEI